MSDHFEIVFETINVNELNDIVVLLKSEHIDLIVNDNTLNEVLIYENQAKMNTLKVRDRDVEAATQLITDYFSDNENGSDETEEDSEDHHEENDGVAEDYNENDKKSGENGREYEEGLFETDYDERRAKSLRYIKSGLFIGLLFFVFVYNLFNEAIPIPDEYNAYIGFWESACHSLYIEKDGRISYSYSIGFFSSGGGGKIKYIGNDKIVYQTWFFYKRTLLIQKPPYEKYGNRRMTLENEDFIIYVKKFE